MNKSPTEIADFDGLGQAQLVAKGKCAPDDPVKAAIARIEERNPELNAIIHFSLDEALAEKSPEPSKQKAIFGMVPIVYKDLMCTSAGQPHHCGSMVLKKRSVTAQVSSYMDESFRQAGFRVLGRTNTPEFGMAPTTEPLAYGATKNPWDKTRSPGGSSGGSGAAVAAGMIPVAHGNDAGGSIRIPSSACGLVGLKPSRGRISVGPEFGEAGPLSHQGVLTRSVRDSAAALDILAGMHAGDPYIAPPPQKPYATESKNKVKGLKIGFMDSVPGGQEELHPECKLAVEQTLRLLEGLGCVVESSFPDRLKDLIPQEFGTALTTSLAGRIAYWEKQLGETIPLEELEPATAIMVKRGQTSLGLEVAQAWEALHRYSREVCGWWDEGFDVLVTPTLPTPPWKLGELAPDNDPVTLLGNMAKVTRFCSPFNITGQPAISLPMYWTKEGLPIGVQLIAKYGREDLLFRLAFALEPNFPSQPPLS